VVAVPSWILVPLWQPGGVVESQIFPIVRTASEGPSYSPRHILVSFQGKVVKQCGSWRETISWPLETRDGVQRGDWLHDEGLGRLFWVWRTR
jgi:hypothetical protein